jgi:hypothetical protein
MAGSAVSNTGLPTDVGCSADSDGGSYGRRVARALDRWRIGIVAIVTLLLSAQSLTSSAVLDFFSPWETALVWFEHLAEIAVLTTLLTLAYTLADEALRRTPRHVRLAVISALLLTLSAALSLLLYAYYAHGFDHLPPLTRLLSDSLRFGLPAVFLVLVADAHQRALQVDSAAHAAEVTRMRLGNDEALQRLALLQAQIEPHFLFNVLGNLRRLYRTKPQAGADAIDSLMRYLRAALPQFRVQNASLRSELDLARAYLDLLKLRMGPRLTFSIDTEPALAALNFPPMLLITLVENAFKHGLEPIGGGNVVVRVIPREDTLDVAVIDDGVGMGAAPNSGTGVGLANVRRQIAARYGRRARLTIQANAPRGTCVTLSIPVRERLAVRPLTHERPA